MAELPVGHDDGLASHRTKASIASTTWSAVLSLTLLVNAPDACTLPGLLSGISIVRLASLLDLDRRNRSWFGGRGCEDGG